MLPEKAPLCQLHASPAGSWLSNQPRIRSKRPSESSQIFICFVHTQKGVTFFFLREIKETNLYTLKKKNPDFL